jgi:hypothetical protein
VSVVIPDHEKVLLYGLAIAAVVLLIAWCVLNEFYVSARSAAQAARRGALLLGGLNQPLSPSEIQSLRGLFSFCGGYAVKGIRTGNPSAAFSTRLGRHNSPEYCRVGCIIELIEQISFEFSVRSLGQVSAEYPRGSRFLEAPNAEAPIAALIVITRRADVPCDPSRQKLCCLCRAHVSPSRQKSPARSKVAGRGSLPSGRGASVNEESARLRWSR